MKKFFISCFLSALGLVLHAQTSQADIIADKIAQKMSDSLSLSSAQKSQLFQINLDLQSRKRLVWQQYPDIDSIQVHLQKIENARDSLYRSVLTDDQFLIYSQKKKNLVNNN